MRSHPTSRIPAAAATHALLLPDILFSIVPHLDFHSLFRGKRVCKTWQSVISRSHEARQILFLETDSTPFKAFKAAEEYDIAARSPAAWQRPSNRIRSRPEFRAMFNPWIFTHGCEPINSLEESEIYGGYFLQLAGRIPPTWRFTDRVSSGRLDFCLIPAELRRFASNVESACTSMFLTQPPVKRVLITVQGGYMSEEKVDLEKDEGVRIGDILAFVRATKAVSVMSKRNGKADFTTIELKFDEHYTGVKFMPMQQLVEDQSPSPPNYSSE
ncbi:hypothetical protein N0V91_010931 [Didymella pomorum]|jgi:hypothetical protein|uniref:F-box domain-containing protein n=1 Tax=Didymella pomorum TaxID=749634 RepID=A0A9W8YYC8_9PLEO|nr:hypothetical protein N0V91_010931 [Didymella pomorum]